MNREAAIEAGARAAFIEDAGLSGAIAAEIWDGERNGGHAVKNYWRRIVTSALDAAAPHLAGEPVGYDYARVPGLFATPAAARQTLTTFGDKPEGYVLVALVSVKP